MDWRRLQSFKNISKFKSFTEASKELKKSQSSLSRDIIILEKSTGYKIFKLILGMQKLDIHFSQSCTSNIAISKLS